MPEEADSQQDRKRWVACAEAVIKAALAVGQDAVIQSAFVVDRPPEVYIQVVADVDAQQNAYLRYLRPADPARVVEHLARLAPGPDHERERRTVSRLLPFFGKWDWNPIVAAAENILREPSRNGRAALGWAVSTLLRLGFPKRAGECEFLDSVVERARNSLSDLGNHGVLHRLLNEHHEDPEVAGPLTLAIGITAGPSPGPTDGDINGGVEHYEKIARSPEDYQNVLGAICAGLLTGTVFDALMQRACDGGEDAARLAGGIVRRLLTEGTSVGVIVAPKKLIQWWPCLEVGGLGWREAEQLVRLVGAIEVTRVLVAQPFASNLATLYGATLSAGDQSDEGKRLLRLVSDGLEGIPEEEWRCALEKKADEGLIGVAALVKEKLGKEPELPRLCKALEKDVEELFDGARDLDEARAVTRLTGVECLDKARRTELGRVVWDRVCDKPEQNTIRAFSTVTAAYGGAMIGVDPPKRAVALRKLAHILEAANLAGLVTIRKFVEQGWWRTVEDDDNAAVTAFRDALLHRWEQYGEENDDEDLADSEQVKQELEKMMSILGIRAGDEESAEQARQQGHQVAEGGQSGGSETET